MAARKNELGRAAKGGVLAGVIGGAVLSIFMLIMSIAKGQDVWMGMKMAALPFIGDAAMQGGFDFGPVMLGVVSHFAVSIAWGLLFGLLFYGMPKGATVWLGVPYGIAVWIGMFYVVLPIVGAGKVAGMMPVGMAVMEHILFGVAVALGFLPFQRHIRRHRPLPAAPA